jgi:hypothetical protein
MKKNKNKEKFAVIQIAILLVATFAFAWIIGGGIGIVGAADEPVAGGDGTALCGAGGTCVNTATSFCAEQIPGNCATPGEICCKPGEPPELVKPEDVPKEEDTPLLDTAEKVGGGLTALETVKKLGLDKEGGKSKTKINDFFKFFKTADTLAGQIVSNALWAAVAATIITQLAKKYASERNAGDLKTVAWVGAGVGVGITTIWAVVVAESAAGPPGWIAAAVTVVAAGIYMLVGYQVYSREIFTFYPKLWQPPVGGDSCNLCNEIILPNGESGCSEYICHSYGQACDWINDESDYERCIEINIGDKESPIITPLKEAYDNPVFPSEDYDYINDSGVGAKIIYNGEGGTCVPPFSGLKIAVATNEEAYCKISLEGNPVGNDEEIFENMMDLAEGNVNTKEHTLELPTVITASSSSLENAGYILRNGGNFEFYIRCRDVRGNINEVDYIMSFCVQQGPDTTPPKIIGTSPEQGSYIKNGELNISNFRVDTNEPADCRWDFERKSYSAMNYEFERCSQNINDPVRGLYGLGCTGVLEGFVSSRVNTYYISCIDQPELKGTENENKRNDMSAYEMTLIGTSPLSIQNIKINGGPNGTTVRDSAERINVKLDVETFAGAEEGKARCKYSDDVEEPNINLRSYSLFSNNGNRDYIYKNVHNLYLLNGTYNYSILCEDVAGNADEETISFSVESDGQEPGIIRYFKSSSLGGNYLQIITNEPSTCVYSNFGCEYYFDDGTSLISESGDYGQVHYAEWNINQDYYIKCQDEFGNRPGPEDCSATIRPFEIPELRN